LHGAIRIGKWNNEINNAKSNLRPGHIATPLPYSLDLGQKTLPKVALSVVPQFVWCGLSYPCSNHMILANKSYVRMHVQNRSAISA